jgi:hypothetical protein
MPCSRSQTEERKTSMASPSKSDVEPLRQPHRAMYVAPRLCTRITQLIPILDIVGSCVAIRPACQIIQKKLVWRGSHYGIPSWRFEQPGGLEGCTAELHRCCTIREVILNIWFCLAMDSLSMSAYLLSRICLLPVSNFLLKRATTCAGESCITQTWWLSSKTYTLCLWVVIL